MGKGTDDDDDGDDDDDDDRGGEGRRAAAADDNSNNKDNYDTDDDSYLLHYKETEWSCIYNSASLRFLNCRKWFDLATPIVCLQNQW